MLYVTASISWLKALSPPISSGLHMQMIPSPPLLLWTNVITYNTLNNTFTTILPAYQYWNYHTWKNKTIHSQDTCSTIYPRYIAAVDSYKYIAHLFSCLLSANYAKPWISLLPQHSRQVGKTSLKVLKVRLHLSWPGDSHWLPAFHFPMLLT